MDELDEPEFLEFVIQIVENQLKDKRKSINLWYISWISSYKWHEPRTSQELTIANRIKLIFEKVLKNYSSLIDPNRYQLEILYWSALSAGVVEEKHIAELYKMVQNDPNFSYTSWHARESKNAQPLLASMLQSENLNIARLAAVSLSSILKWRTFLHEPKRIKIKEIWVSDKLWELAKDKEDIWRPRYIEGIAYCQLKWAEKCEEWLQAIKETNTKEPQSAWCQVIEEAGYYKATDRNALFNLLLRILESGDTFAKPIRFAALRRLDKMVSEVEPVGFDEEQLNLPLSRRAKVHLS